MGPVAAHWSAAAILLLVAWLCAGYVLPAAAPRHPTSAYWLLSSGVAVVFVVTLLAHELAHAIVARRYGLSVRSVTLWLLGGVTDLDGDPPSPRAEAWIAAAGPLASIGIGLLGAALVVTTGTSGLLGAAATWLAEVNLLLAVFNLVPGMPMDGGRLLRALLWWRYHDRARAADAVTRFGRSLGAVLIGLGLLELLLGGAGGLWLALIGWFVRGSAGAEQYSTGVDRLDKLTVGQLMTPVEFAAPQWWTVQQLVDELWARPRAWNALPVVDIAGDLTGVVTVAGVARVPASDRDTVRLRDITVRSPAPTTLPPDAPASACVPAMRRRELVVVTEGRRPVGLVTPSAVPQAIQLASLHQIGNRPDEQHVANA